jgi:ubiquinone/menaquinone biosynthesis C-methylase UbiE
MESPKQHEGLVTGQFGPQAAAYVSSEVHASGDDLRQLERLLAGRSGACLLDLGCGGGHVSFTAAPLVAQVTAYDLSEEMLAAVAEAAAQRGLGNITTRQGAAEHLPFADATFDVVATRYSAHHWRDVQTGIREAARVLKPHGLAVIMDVVSPGPAMLDTHLQAIELLRDTSHVRDWSVAEWRQIAADAGLMTGTVTTHRLTLDFASWVERMRTPEVFVRAIRALQDTASADVRSQFEIQKQGTFSVDTMCLEASRELN